MKADTPNAVKFDACSDHRILGLTDDEYDRIVDILGRAPNPTELAIYAVMWSEHCSYKSSRVHLGRLPSEGVQVIVGPGENAGVVDVGDGVAIALRIESHNHPSFIEPYQGAATGVGGILRDIFTVGARPIALMDAIFFGSLEDDHSRYIADGVVRGIAGYGNAVGVPTVGGQVTFDSTYRANPLVNVFCLGLLPISRLVLAKASGTGNKAVLLGARTGRDGIGGVSVLASAGFGGPDDPAATSKRPNVQIADPFEEKRLIEACLELLEAGLVVGIQDLGGAGLSCATSETAARGGVGIDVDARVVPRREPSMTAAEVMTSESQERMLAIVAPGFLDRVFEVCDRWEVEATAIGTVTEPDEEGTGWLRVVDSDAGNVVASIPAASLVDGAPKYRRPLAPPPYLEEQRANDPDVLDVPRDPGADLLALLDDPAPIYTQYDHRLFLNTVLGPGEADATVLKLAAPGIPYRGKGLALSVDANPGWCRVDPRIGASATVAESALNVACSGARPVALVDCLNFGNPEHPEVMWQLSESIDGIAEACRALSIPVVGGNVSLYNESSGVDIEPSPVVAVVGVIDDLERKPPSCRWTGDARVVLLGEATETLAGSRWAREIRGCRGGRLRAVDWEAHVAVVRLVSDLVAAEVGAHRRAGVVSALHDVSQGGIAVALAECALAAGIGVHLDDEWDHGRLFSEAPSRVLVATSRPDALLDAARRADVPAKEIGSVGGNRLVVGTAIDLAMEELANGAARIARAFTFEASI
ncbi:MAG: phosphoribosylformylglycinamidine synthase subunit PurL [Acidimicrobiales bacterium]